MKTKKDLTVILITSAVCLLPLIFSIAVYTELPHSVAIHWNFAGVPDNFVPKAWAAFGLPFLFLIINLFSKLCLFNDPKRAATSQAMQIFAAWMPPVLSVILVPVTLLIALGVNISIALITPIILGVVFIICGNYLPKSRQNYTVGIKTPWTLHDADNWNKTHRLAGYLYVLGGFALIVSAFVFDNSGRVNGVYVAVGVAILLCIIPLVYSYLLYRKG